MQNPPNGTTMNVSAVGRGQFGNQLIKRDLTFGCDTRIYSTGHPSQLSMCAAIPVRSRQK